ncbi:MAG: hypothetical protein ACYC5H_13210 [Methylovirgula sp.]
MTKDHQHGDAPRPAAPQRDWRHIHHSPLFWVGVALFLAAMMIYVWSDDLSWHLRAH